MSLIKAEVRFEAALARSPRSQLGAMAERTCRRPWISGRV